MTVPVNAPIRAVATFDLDAISKAQNVYHFSHISSSEKSDAAVVTAAGEFVDDIMTTLASYIHEDVVLEKVEVYAWVTNEWQPLGVATPAFVGTDATTRVPSGVALLINAFKERTGHSDKKYIAGLTETGLAADTWVAGVLTAAANYLAIWLVTYNGSGSVDLLPVHWNRVGKFMMPYSTGSVATRVSYQRRRRPGVGLT